MEVDRFLGRVSITLIALIFANSFASASDLQDQLIIKSSIDTVKKDDSIIIGHNVTPTTDTPKAGKWTVGNYALGVGLTNKIFIATSPWIWASYNTANIHLKWSTPINRQWKIGFFASYFDSYNNTQFLTDRDYLVTSDTGRMAVVSDTNRYQWQSASAHFLASCEFSKSVKTNFNAHYAYFWNDEFPYSIRMDPGSDSIRGQVDLTTLTEVKIDSNLKWLFEFGALGVNYIYPYMQLGSSLAYADQDWLVQLGASYTVAWDEAKYQTGWSPGRYDSRIHYTPDGNPYERRYLQTAMHPEIQVQYFF